MKKIICLIALALLTIVPIKAAEVQESIMNVNMSYEKEYNPDTVNISFSLTDSGLNIKDIKEKNDKTINNAINAIKKELKENETIKTTSYNVRPIYNYKDKVKVFQKYEITNSFEVKLKDLSKISSIIKIATDNGIKNVGNVRFYIEDKEKISNETIAEVIKLAKLRANTIASASGVSISKIKNINANSSLDNNYSGARYYSKSMFLSANSDSAAALEEATPVIEPGKIKVSASVNIDYYLK